MKYIIAFFIATCVVVCAAERASPEVYLNRQWNELFQDWDIMGLMVEGTSLTVDRSYQNAYGEVNELPPGPPFIIEWSVNVSTLLDGNDDVITMGSLTFQAGGAGGSEDFEIIFTPEYVTSETKINTRGMLRFLGESSDPIIFTGMHEIRSYYHGGNDPGGAGSFDIEFRHCRFEAHQYSEHWSSIPFVFQGGNVTFDHCTFKNFHDPVSGIILDYDHNIPDQWMFEMRDCSIENNYMPDYGHIPVWLDRLGGVIIENNSFVNNAFLGGQEKGVLTIDDCRLGRIAGNEGSGNASNSIHLREYTKTREGENGYIRSRFDFPVIVTEIHIPHGSSLEIAEGSLLKLYHMLSGTNFHVGGNLFINGATFTSWEDDSLGGDTDFKPQPVYLSRWGNFGGGIGGIAIEPTGSGDISGSTFLYANVTLSCEGDVLIDDCECRYNEKGFLILEGQSYSTYTIRNSTFEHTYQHVNGFYLDNEGGLSHALTIENCSILQCGEGVTIRCLGVTPTEITITGCTIAGNRGYGIYAMPGPGLHSLRIERSIISANHYDGIYAWSGGAAEPVIDIESCVMAGNGWIGNYSLQSSGANIRSGTLHFIGNSALLNRGHGLYHTIDLPGDERVANNILAWNHIYGYVKEQNEHPLFAHNDIWGNDNQDIFFNTSGGVLFTVEEVQALGGEFATNMRLDPLLLPATSGEAASVSYDDATKRSVLVASGAPFENGRCTGMIVNPNTSQDDWYYVISNTDDSLVVAEDISAIASAGDTFTVFDHHCAAGSPMIDAGDNAYVRSAMDIDGEHRIIDGDEDMLTIVDIGADEFNPDSFSILVIDPQTDDHLISGEEHEIRWSAVDIDVIDIMYAAHYDPVGGNPWDTIAIALPAADGRYEWTVPDTMSTRCMIKVVDAEHAARSALSGLFSIKGYVLARLDTGGEYEPFLPGKDDWRFANTDSNMWPGSWWSQFDYEDGIDPYTGQPYPYYFTSHAWTFARPSDFPDWPLFVCTFGTEQCYFDSPAGLVYRPSAVLKWANIKEEWGGSCFGFAVSSLLAFDDGDGFRAAYPDVAPFDTLYHLALTDDHRKTVNRIMIAQHGNGFYDRIKSSFGKSPNETLEEVKEMLLADTRDDRWLYLADKNGSGAHAVSPYKVENDTQHQGIEYIYIYDSNYPNNAETRIAIDSAAGTWEYDHIPGWGSDTLLALGDPVDNYLAPPVLEVPGSNVGWPSFAYSNGVRHEIYNTPGVSITISDESGHTIGFADSAAFGDMPDGYPIIPIAGRYHPPIGYGVPAGHHTIEMSDFIDTLVVLSVFEDSIVYSYARTDAAPSQRDLISCGDALSITNEDGDEKTCGAEVIAIGINEEKVYDIFEWTLGPDDSMRCAPRGTDSLEIVNHGPEKTYTLGLRMASTDSNGVFEHADIIIPSVSTHIVIPSWEDIETIPVKILIDYGNDGTIDDSIFVENEFVATLLRDYDIYCRKHCIEIRWRLTERDEETSFTVLRSAGGGPFRDTGIEIHDDGLSLRAIDAEIECAETYRYRIDVTSGGRSRVLFETEPVMSPPLPLILYQNYPNPFNPATTISFYLPTRTRVHLAVYDLEGRRIAVLIDGTLAAGLKRIEWDGKNARGDFVDSGIYFYRLRAGKRTLTRKLVIVR